MSKKKLTVTFKGYDAVHVFYDSDVEYLNEPLDRAAKKATKDKNAFWFKDSGLAGYGQLFSSREWGNTSITGKISCDVVGL